MTDGLWAPARRATTIGLVLLVTLVAFEALAVNTALPDAADELGSLGLYGWVFAAFMLAMVASIALSGRAIDERGLHPVLAVGAPLFCAGLLIGATAPSMVVLVGGRIVQGLGAGAISSVSNVAIGRAYPPRLRAAMLAVMSSAWVVPGLVGPGLSAVVTSSIGWRWVFAGLIPFVGVAAGLTLPALRPFGPTDESRAHAATRRPTDALLVAIGFAIVIGGLSNAQAIWPLLLLLVGGAIARPALRRLSPGGTFRLAPGPPAAIALNAVINVSFFSVDAFLPLAVAEVRGRGVGFAGLALSVGALSWAAGAWVTAHMQRISVTVRVRAGFLFLAVAIALTLVGLHPDVPIQIFPFAWVLAGLGMGLGYQSLALVVLGGADSDGDAAAAHTAPTGFVVAARQIFDTLGTATGTGVAGAIVAVATASDRTTRDALVGIFVLMIAVAVFGAAVSGRVERRNAPLDAPARPRS